MVTFLAFCRMLNGFAKCFNFSVHLRRQLENLPLTVRKTSRRKTRPVSSLGSSLYTQSDWQRHEERFRRKFNFEMTKLSLNFTFYITDLIAKVRNKRRISHISRVNFLCSLYFLPAKSFSESQCRKVQKKSNFNLKNFIPYWNACILLIFFSNSFLYAAKPNCASIPFQLRNFKFSYNSSPSNHGGKTKSCAFWKHSAFPQVIW